MQYHDLFLTECTAYHQFFWLNHSNITSSQRSQYILFSAIALSLSVSLLSVQIQWTSVPAAHQAVAQISGEERDGRQFSVFHQFANCSESFLSPNYASIKVMNSLFILFNALPWIEKSGNEQRLLSERAKLLKLEEMSRVEMKRIVEWSWGSDEWKRIWTAGLALSKNQIRHS